jgi:uncharacterized protein YlxW (UPF0749 family)
MSLARKVAPLLAVALLFIAALAVVAIVLAGQNSDLRTDVGRLSGQVATLSKSVKMTDAQLNTINASQDQAKVSALEDNVSKIKDCLPELEAEITGLQVDGTGYVTTNQQVSRQCSGLLYGPPGE